MDIISEMDNIINAVAANRPTEMVNPTYYLETIPKKKGRKPKLTPDAEIEEYSIANIERFIELIEERPHIWEYIAELGLKNEVVVRLWSEVEQLCSTFVKQARSSGKNAQILWAKLKREFKKENEIQIEKNAPPVKFRFYANMAFLLKEKRLYDESQDSFNWNFMLKPDTAVKIEETESSSREPSVSRKRDREETMDELLYIMRESNESLKKLVSFEDVRSSYLQKTTSKNKDLHDFIDSVLDKMPFMDQHLMKSKITQFVISSYQEYTTGNKE